jgi:PiT family inorganic phosphate transporter
VIQWNGLWDKVVKPSVLAPVLGFAIALGLMFAIVWVIRRRSPSKVNRVFRRAQIVSGGFVSFTHGANDAQKTMGIIALALIASGHLQAEPFTVPTWVIFASGTAMALGTYAGGWRIIKTLGTRIAKIDPPQGFAAQTACAGILWTTAHLGFPVSTTHTISGSVMGAGASRRFSAVRWGVAGNIVIAWILTLPAAALVGAIMERVSRMPDGDVVVVLLAAVISATAFLGRRYETRRRLVPAAPSHRPLAGRPEVAPGPPL